MAKSWAWFNDVIEPKWFNGVGGTDTVHRDLLEGESVQRVLVMGSFQGWSGYNIPHNSTPQMPSNYFWRYELSVDYTATDSEVIAKRSGAFVPTFAAAGANLYAMAFYQWEIPARDLDVDITVRKKMGAGSGSQLGVTLTFTIDMPTDNNLQTRPVLNGTWYGGIFMRTLRTTA